MAIRQGRKWSRPFAKATPKYDHFDEFQVELSPGPGAQAMAACGLAGFDNRRFAGQQRSMDENHIASVKTSIGNLRQAALKAFRTQLRSIYFGRSSLGFVGSIKVREAVRAAEQNARSLVGDVVSQVAKVSIEPSAFSLVDECVGSHLLELEATLEGGLGMPLISSDLEMAAERFEVVRSSINRSLEVHRTRFVGDRDTGGRPEEYDWKGAEDHVLTHFPQGIPRIRGTKAKIARLMADWFSEKINETPSSSLLEKHAAKIVKERG